jgi:hypothetical protein
MWITIVNNYILTCRHWSDTSVFIVRRRAEPCQRILNQGVLVGRDLNLRENHHLFAQKIDVSIQRPKDVSQRTHSLFALVDLGTVRFAFLIDLHTTLHYLTVEGTRPLLERLTTSTHNSSPSSVLRTRIKDTHVTVPYHFIHPALQMTLQMLSIAFACLYAGTEAFLLPERSFMTRSTTFIPTTTTSSPLTSCFMSKNSDRAHIERNLEAMMNNDWRVFRADLVAQERAEKADPESSSASHSGAGGDGLQKQEGLSDMFAGAISNIFRNKSAGNINKRENIFAGDTVGGALPGDDDNTFLFEDPFVSAEELPLLLKPKVKINKHRWAHEISNVEPGCVLIANEKLGGVFHQTVVLIIEHHENSGSIGVVINR